METVKWVVLFLSMGVNSICDLKSRKIMLSVTILGSVIGVIWQLVIPTKDYLDLVYGLLIGVCALVISKVTNGALGYGDGLILLMCGIWLGGRYNFLLCTTGIVLAGVWAIILLVCFRKRKEYEIPFVPFLFLGLIWVRYLS